ncbi:hypothetical protein Godav_003646 [Gossypium davidsonii]|uniref:L-ascorbate peroxidase n=1 Tax=Gossypium davidsonii TaxID=34287 RepID=A0A7J8SIG6_GOSDV|nr:hypothetical protein [Gossypium davidsonii]
MTSSLGNTASSRISASSSPGVRLSLHPPSSFSLLSFSSSFKPFAFSPLSSHFSPHQRRSAVHVSSSRGFGTVASPKCAASNPDQLKSAREDLKRLLNSQFCHPILVRLGWHDAGTYNKNIEEWPQRGGANGSLRFEVELKHAANAGLVNALSLIQPIKDKYSDHNLGIAYASFFRHRYQCIRLCLCLETTNLIAFLCCSDAGPPSPADHLREVFYRMGLNDKEIVALSGAHTLGRSRPERSGWGKPETKYTKDGPGTPGGQSWTVQWLKFDNSYFKDIKAKRDEDLLVLPTDAVLFEDSSFKVYAEKYAEDQETFFKDYAEAHAKLSNLGAKFDPPEGIVLDDTPVQAVPEKFVAAKYSTGKRELSDSMKQKIRAEYESFGGGPDKPLPTNYFLNIIIIIGVLAILTSLLGNY